MKKTTAYLLSLLSLCIAPLSAKWDQPITEIHCTIAPIDRAHIHPRNSHIPSATTQAVSTNWSGYVAATNLSGASSANGTVTHVTGSWIVPTLLPTTDDTYCAIWVGIDGYASNTVEQIGTSHNWLNGSQQNYAWFEMYPKGAYEIIGFPVDNGDTIRARVHYKGNNTFRLVIYNETQSVFTVIPKSYTMSTKAKRSCAEWIVEAPYLGGILPLSDFQSVTFQRCATIINGIKGPINSTSWVNDEITMEDSGGLEAQPSDLLENGSYFRVVWQSE